MPFYSFSPNSKIRLQKIAQAQVPQYDMAIKPFSSFLGVVNAT
ncbi:hypothetical protein KsCSTR_28090 [Candidatus Kuenenia stuttgartiensis]|uniref:Uncharacterized protein n=1 Tax=Kuenenia stuttgartiensis TaxID=174633 RepID=A0A6G7GRI0_KUEST|nr:hypothetical protein KsCSTR_28090 [Candidatus Kuenenia stuttgartiensis]